MPAQIGIKIMVRRDEKDGGLIREIGLGVLPLAPGINLWEAELVNKLTAAIQAIVDDETLTALLSGGWAESRETEEWTDASKKWLGKENFDDVD